MTNFKGFPIIDAASHLDRQIQEGGYPAVRNAIGSLSVNSDQALRDLEVSLQYLSDYSAVPGTYNRFRSEVQRFLNYLWVVSERTLVHVDSQVVTSYFKFLKTPPASWVAPSIFSGFQNNQGSRAINPRWRPFTNQRSKTKRYEASSVSLQSSRTALTSYFRFLRQHQIISGDPFLEVRRRNIRAKPSTVLNQQEHSVRRYTNWQWSYIRNTLEQSANVNSYFERHLFIIITMKTLFLRISEISVRSIDGQTRVPVFSDFKQQVQHGEEFWVYNTLGKGDKKRSITCPDEFITFLKRWRSHLGCPSPLPLPGELGAILPSKRGGGLSSRQIQRICEEGIMLAVRQMKADGFLDEAIQLAAIASETHYLRHTGASQAIEDGANIRHISEELGHSSAGFTEQIYVNADQRKRRSSGRKRAI